MKFFKSLVYFRKVDLRAKNITDKAYFMIKGVITFMYLWTWKCKAKTNRTAK
jgi:hypothetical protein